MLNHIFIMGRLTRDPELRYTQSQLPVASFTLAVDRDFKSDNGERGVDFIDCVAWRKTAEFVNSYFRKGSMAVASGRLQLRDWQDRDGNKRRSAEVVVDNIYFGESKRDADNNAGTTARSSYDQPGSHYDTDNRRGTGYGRNYQDPAPVPVPGPAYQQQTFTELDDGDGELPF